MVFLLRKLISGTEDGDGRASLRVSAWVERVLHPLRRRLARGVVRNAGLVRSVLFVCHGNVCRSPFAASALRRDLDAVQLQQVQIRSAGFFGAGRQPPDQAVREAGRRGLDLSGHTSLSVTRTIVTASDLLVVMSEDQAVDIASFRQNRRIPIVLLGDLDPIPIHGRAIQDPWSREDSVFESSYARIERCVAELARLLADAAHQQQAVAQSH